MEDSPAAADPRRRQEFLDALVRDHRGFLEAMATRLCRSQLDPGDLVQDVLERLIANVDRIPPELPVRAWLVRVMHNRFIDMVRRQHPTAAIEPEQLAEPPREPEAWWHRLSTDDVRQKIDALPPELRDAFRMFSLDGLSYQEISERLGVTRNTVGTRILRARRRIRAMFTGDDHE